MLDGRAAGRAGALFAGSLYAGSLAPVFVLGFRGDEAATLAKFTSSLDDAPEKAQAIAAPRGAAPSWWRSCKPMCVSS